MMKDAGSPLPLEGRVAAQPPGGVVSASLDAGLASRASATTPSGRFAAISPSRGESAPVQPCRQ